MDRKQLGQERLGAPVMASFEALVGVVDEKPWGEFRREPVGYYFEKMIGGWLLRLMDSALSDAQLKTVNAGDVKVVVLLLFRDMFRHNVALLRPDAENASWVEPLFNEVAERLDVPRKRIADNGEPYEIEDMSQCAWAQSLAEPFGLPAVKLFACHSAIVTGVTEEFA